MTIWKCSKYQWWQHWWKGYPVSFHADSSFSTKHTSNSEHPSRKQLRVEFDLSRCLCDVPITDAEKSEQCTIIACQRKGCETVWVVLFTYYSTDFDHTDLHSSSTIWTVFWWTTTPKHGPVTHVTAQADVEAERQDYLIMIYHIWAWEWLHS